MPVKRTINYKESYNSAAEAAVFQIMSAHLHVKLFWLRSFYAVVMGAILYRMM